MPVIYKNMRWTLGTPGTLRALALLAWLSALILSGKLLAEDAPAAPRADPQPTPTLLPEDVISLQMKALSGPGPVEGRVARCYNLASPANRMHTGPLTRFATMIQAPKYSVLLQARHFLVGRAVQNGREAHLLLTVVDGNGNLSLFRCFLSKQTAAPYADCWMTDGVIRVGEVNPQPNPPPPTPKPAPSI
jgi:hypothetical protein